MYVLDIYSLHFFLVHVKAYGKTEANWKLFFYFFLGECMWPLEKKSAAKHDMVERGNF